MRRMNSKLFKNGGSWAVRLPADWLGDSPEVQLVQKGNGVIEVRLLSKQELLKALVADTLRDPLTEADIPITKRTIETDRFDIAQLIAERG